MRLEPENAWLVNKKRKKTHHPSSAGRSLLFPVQFPCSSSPLCKAQDTNPSLTVLIENKSESLPQPVALLLVRSQEQFGKQLCKPRGASAVLLLPPPHQGTSPSTPAWGRGSREPQGHGLSDGRRGKSSKERWGCSPKPVLLPRQAGAVSTPSSWQRGAKRVTTASRPLGNPLPCIRPATHVTLKFLPDHGQNHLSQELFKLNCCTAS